MQLLVEPIWPWPVVLLVAAGLLASAWWAYRGRFAKLGSRRWGWLLSLRLVASLMLVFAMLRPARQFTETTAGDVQVLVALDASRSMTVADAQAGATRWEVARKALESMPDTLQGAGVGQRPIVVKKFLFDRTLRPWDAAAEPTGDFSALGASLDDLHREARSRRTLGAILLSDGAPRAIPPFDVDPRASARRLAAEQTPLYTVTYGAPGLQGQGLDLAIEDFVMDHIVFERKTVPVSGRLRISGTPSQPITIRVLIEDRLGRRLGESGELKVAPPSGQSRPVREIPAPREPMLLPVELSFTPQQAGELKVALEVVPARDELLTRNNRLETVVTVRSGGLKAAYFDVPRTEVKFLNMVNGSAQIQLDYHELRPLKGRAKPIDAGWFAPGKYEAFVIGDVPADAFPPRALEQLAERLRDGAGLLMTGGFRNFFAGGYGNSPLAEYLPVALDRADDVVQVDQPTRMAATEIGQRRYIMQIDAADKNRRRWEGLAALEGVTRLRPKNRLVEVLAEGADGAPLLLASEVGKARVLAFGGDSTWQWVMQGDADAHQRFWRQIILWLARKEIQSGQTIWASVDPRNFARGASVPISFGARAEDGAPRTDVDWQVEVIAPDGTRRPVSARQVGDQFSAEFSDTQTSGDYWVKVKGTKDGVDLGLDAYSRFIVDTRDLELDSPASDPALMQDLAQSTGGAAIPPEDVASLLQRLAETRLPDLEQIRLTTLWDNWWLLLIYVGVLSAEWALRKIWGLV